MVYLLFSSVGRLVYLVASCVGIGVYLAMLYNGVILKQATTALRLCLDSSLCQTIFLDLYGCSVWREGNRLWSW